MYWVCVRCSEAYYTSRGTITGTPIEEPWPCEVCGCVTGAEFEQDPELASTTHLLADSKGRVIAISRDLEQVLGWSELEAMGMESSELVFAIGPDVVMREMETLSGSRLLECHVGVPIA